MTADKMDSAAKYCEVLLLLLTCNNALVYASDLLRPMESSGSGMELDVSGSGIAPSPMLLNCPTEPIRINTTRANTIQINITSGYLPGVDSNDTQLNVTGLNTSDPDQGLLATSAENCNSSSECIMLQLITSPFTIPNVGSVEFNISLVAVDCFGSVSDETCVLNIILVFNTPIMCALPDTPQTITVSTGAREIASISIEIDTDNLTASDTEVLREEGARAMNSYCTQNCDQCGYMDDCEDILELCFPFTRDDIQILSQSIEQRTSHRGQSNFVTILELYVEVPEGAVLMNQNRAPLILAEVTRIVFGNVTDVFTNATGISVIGEPQLFVTPATQATEGTGIDAAIITVPIVAALLVVALFVGVLLILVIAFIYKNVKTKVQPAGENNSKKKSKLARGSTIMNVDNV